MNVLICIGYVCLLPLILLPLLSYMAYGAAEILAPIAALTLTIFGVLLCGMIGILDTRAQRLEGELAERDSADNTDSTNSAER